MPERDRSQESTSPDRTYTQVSESIAYVSAYRGRSSTNDRYAREGAVSFHHTPMFWHHLALRSAALDGDADVLLDGQLVGVLLNEEGLPFWQDAEESLTLAGGQVDELMVFDHALDAAALCKYALGGRWCGGAVCGLP